MVGTPCSSTAVQVSNQSTAHELQLAPAKVPMGCHTLAGASVCSAASVWPDRCSRASTFSPAAAKGTA
jgi:hypothetical protein